MSARTCISSPTRWCNLRECYGRNVKCKLEIEEELEIQRRQRIYDWAHHKD